MSTARSENHRTAAAILAAALVALFAVLVVREAGSTSATSDEVAHLPSGYSYLAWNDYRMNPEHPPLVKKLAALFMLSQHPVVPDMATAIGTDAEAAQMRAAWDIALAQPKYEWDFGHSFLYRFKPDTLARFGVKDQRGIPTTVVFNPSDFANRADRLIFWGRLGAATLGLFLAVLIFAWACELWGWWGGVLSLGLLCLDPNFVAHSGLITTDVGEAAFMFGAIYFLWRTCRRISAPNVAGMLLCFGLAFVSKFTSVLLVPMFFALLLIRTMSGEEWVVGGGCLSSWRKRAAVAAAICTAVGLAAYVAIWASYGFRYSAAADPGAAAKAEQKIMAINGISRDQWSDPGHFPLEYVLRKAAVLHETVTDTTTSVAEKDVSPLLSNARISQSGRLLLWANRNRILPEAYLYGFASAEMNSIMRSSFLMGSISSRGWRDYFLWSFLFKTPVASIVLIAAGMLLLFRRERRAYRAGFLLAPVLIYCAVSASAHLNIGQRHIFPIYPFLFVLAGGCCTGGECLLRRIRLPRAAWVVCSAAVGVALLAGVPHMPAYSHPLAYFNGIAGGSDGGCKLLTDSNIDWGQDLPCMKAWLDTHPLDGKLYFSYFGTADPRYYGIRHISTPRCMGGYYYEPSPYTDVAPQDDKAAIEQFEKELHPGDYIAISATNASGVLASDLSRSAWIEILANSVLVDKIGFSIFLYRFSPK